MAFTPTNLYVESGGSTTLYIARVAGSVTSGTNNWATGIPNIISVIGSYSAILPSESIGALAVSFTQTDGTIWTDICTGASGTPFTLWIHAGLAQDQM